MDFRKISKNYLSLQGYNFIKEDKILSYISYKFLIFEKDNERIAGYVLKKDESIYPLIDAAKVCNGSNHSLKILIFSPGNILLPGDLNQKLYNSNIELYTINEGNIDPFIRSSDIKLREKYTIEQIEKLLKTINFLSKKNFSTPIFKIDKKSLYNLKLNVSSKEEFVLQISEISSIIEHIEYRSIKNSLSGLKQYEIEAFEKNQSISSIECFLKKHNLMNKNMVEAINDFRNLRDLRNIPPIHNSKKYIKPSKDYIGKIPSENSDWKKLNQIALIRFEASLITLRNTLKK